jgi:creatinine amidohydrolase
MELLYSTWPQVEAYLKTKKTILVPIGSTEQHGPTGIIGTDILTAQSIAIKLGTEMQLLVASPLCYGMSIHHMGFPGSASLTPVHLVQIICDVIKSYKHHGFEEIIFINGHGGNSAPLDTAFSQFKQYHDRTFTTYVNWWTLPEVKSYEDEHFKNQNGRHATVGEISVTQFLYPNVFKNIPSQTSEIKMPESYHWPLSADEYKEFFPDGRMGSNPSLATRHHGERIYYIAINAIKTKIENWLKNK